MLAEKVRNYMVSKTINIDTRAKDSNGYNIGMAVYQVKNKYKKAFYPKV